MGEDEDAAHVKDPDAFYHNNMTPAAAHHIGAQGSRMLAALFEGLDADFFSVVSAVLRHTRLFRWPSWHAWFDILEVSKRLGPAGGHGVEIASAAVHAHARRDAGMEAAPRGRGARCSAAAPARPMRGQVAAALQRGAA